MGEIPFDRTASLLNNYRPIKKRLFKYHYRKINLVAIINHVCATEIHSICSKLLPKKQRRTSSI